MARRKLQRVSLRDFLERFHSEGACRDYLAKTRWPEGFVCPKYGSPRHCSMINGLYQCAECRRQTSVTAGTFLHRSHVPLTKWFLAMYFVTQDKRGISAVQLAHTIGVNYKTAWLMLKKFAPPWGKGTADICSAEPSNLTMRSSAAQLWAKNVAEVQKKQRFSLLCPGITVARST